VYLDIEKNHIEQLLLLPFSVVIFLTLAILVQLKFNRDFHNIKLFI